VFGSDTTVTFRCSETGASTFVDLTAHSIEKIEFNGNAIPASAFTGYRIALDGLKAENTLRVVATCEVLAFGNRIALLPRPYRR
jgi:aminopeptidase N